MRTAEQFWSYVDRGDDCWVWTGGRAGRKHNRGIVNWQGTITSAYRVALEVVGRPAPRGLSVHHLCEQPLCVRPDHLVVVTQAEHSQFHLSAECHRGHPMSGDNLRVIRSGKNVGVRYCRECNRIDAKKYRRAA